MQIYNFCCYKCSIFVFRDLSIIITLYLGLAKDQSFRVFFSDYFSFWLLTDK